MLDLRRIANALGGDISNNQVLAPGPGHSAEDRSLSVKLVPNAPDGFLVHSFAGDDPITCKDHVRQLLNLPAFQPANGRKRRSAQEIENLLAAAVDYQRKPQGTLTATYDYTDADDTLLYQVVRYDNPKRFVQRRPDGKGGWLWNLHGVSRVLYRLPELLKYPSATTFITEGEADSDRVTALDLCASTVASGKWDGVHVECLRGRDIFILQDNDDAGVKKALAACNKLHGIAATVRIVLLPDLPEHGDVSDWLDANRNDKDRLIELCLAAPIWNNPDNATGAEIPAEENNAPVAAPAASEAVPSGDPAPSIPATSSSTSTSSPSPSLPFINVVEWHDQPVPEREWCVLDRIPLRNVTLFSGEGAIGKSIVSLHLGVAHVLGKDWLGSMPEPGPALIVMCEDDAPELHRRLAQILEHYSATFADLKDMHLLSLAGEDARLATLNHRGLIQPTKLFGRLRDEACKIQPKLIVLDNSADIFGGSENDRAQVQQFIAILRALSIAANAGVLLTSHPSLHGTSSGSGISGSTAWHASVRSRLYMKRATTEKDEEPDPNLRIIEVMKSNYGPAGETITVRWKNGLFLPEAKRGSLEKQAADQAVDDLFLRLLDRFELQGRNVSHKPTSNTYAPTMFAKDPDGKGKKKELAAAMERLFAANKIKAENYGRASRQFSKLVRCK